MTDVATPAETADSAAAFCPHCDYDLRASSGDTCPECGGVIERDAARRSRIVWLYRREVGRIRAFWKTAWFVTLRPKQLVHEMARPVDFAEAARFRRAVVMRVAVCGGILIGLSAVTLWMDGGVGFARIEGGGLIATIAGIAAVLMALFAFFATGVQSYWFHPRSLSVERQNRAVALSYYAAAPLAFVSPLVLGLLLASFVGTLGDEIGYLPFEVGGQAAAIVLAALLAAVPVAYLRVCGVMASTLARRRGWSLAWVWVGVPLAWGLLALLIFLLIPGGIAWAWLMLRTLSL